MKSVKHPDGIRRITMKMEVAVDIESLSRYALDMVKNDALQNVPLVVSAADLFQVEEHVRSVFPEID